VKYKYHLKTAAKRKKRSKAIEIAKDKVKRFYLNLNLVILIFWINLNNFLFDFFFLSNLLDK
jgi:hypothetical protein